MVGIELRIGLAPRRKQFVAGDDVVAILVVAVEALLLARLLARLGRLARERRWRCDRFQRRRGRKQGRSEEHTSELQSLMRISYAVFCLKKNKTTYNESKITRPTTH